MGLLAPLYALAALAVIGPIVFHLIKRQPTGQQRFSSLMFLSPSPPRLTRRSRLDNLLLLLLRALAILLITAAFARPFFRQESLLDQTTQGRNIALLVDTSASMQRQEVWDEAMRQASDLLDSLSPNDLVSLYTIDSKLNTVIGVDSNRVTDPAAQRQSVQRALATLKPTWQASALGESLRSAADLFHAASLASKSESSNSHELVLITDLHAGCGMDALQGYPWPEAIQLDVRQVLPKRPGNVRLSLVADDLSDTTQADGSVQKVRVENNADSVEQSFEIQWMNGSAPVSNTVVTRVQVPPGQVRIVTVPTQPSGADRLVLSGDAWDGDNQAFFVKPAVIRQRILFAGNKPTEKEDDLGYFLEKAPLGTASVVRTVERVDVAELSKVLQSQLASSTSGGQEVAAPPERLHAIVAELPLQPDTIPLLKSFAESGGCVILSMARPAEDLTRLSSYVGETLEVPNVAISEAAARDFSLLSSIDYTSSVFKPFADPRFNDFSKIHFWNHRKIDLDLSQQPELQVIAKLDDGSPWLLRKGMNEGNIWLMSSGWQPTSSQLGLSSKFVPILLGMLDPTDHSRSRQLTFSVGDLIPTNAIENVTIRNSGGASVQADVTAEGIRLYEPGIYRVESNSPSFQIAVQVPPSEAQLTPMDKDSFEQFGIKLGKVLSATQLKQNARQLQASELEQKQRVWQWLLLAGLIVLALETVVAGLFSRKASRADVTTEPLTAG